MGKNQETKPIENIGILKECPEDGLMNMEHFRSTEISKPALLLHSCCGPCSTAVIERLASDYRITVFFYNPNITEREEYQKRKATQKEFLQQYNNRSALGERVEFLEGEYDPEQFYKVAQGLEQEPEGGARCTECFRLRLNATAKTALERGFQVFGTTLTVSPHKNYGLITMIGTEIALSYGLDYLDEDFKKKAGYQRSIELSKQYNLYRQSFCGCNYSK